MANEHDDKIDQGLEQAGQKAGERFGHEDQINQAVDKGQEMTGEGDTTQEPPPEGEGEPPPQ